MRSTTRVFSREVTCSVTDRLLPLLYGGESREKSKDMSQEAHTVQVERMVAVGRVMAHIMGTFQKQGVF
jgi:hypothetical protein